MNVQRIRIGSLVRGDRVLLLSEVKADLPDPEVFRPFDIVAVSREEPHHVHLRTSDAPASWARWSREAFAWRIS